MGGDANPLEPRIMDRIHPSWEGRRQIWYKVKGAIQYHYDQKAANLN